MQRVPVELLCENMVVARQVVNDNGIVLVNSGTELTPKMIDRLKNLGIKKVIVQGAPVDMTPYIDKTLREKLSDMEYAFRHSADSPLMQKFRVLLKAHIIKRDNEITGKAPDDTPSDKASRGGLDSEYDMG